MFSITRIVATDNTVCVVGTGAAATRRARSRASTVSTACVSVGSWPASTSQPRDPSV